MALADLLTTSVVEIGKIKIGKKKPKNERGWCPPEKLDHFLITTLHRGNDENLMVDEPLMESLKQEYADPDGKLRQIPVMFGSNDIEEVLTTSYTWYIGKTCGARTDGQVITFYADPETGKLLDKPRNYKWHPSYLELSDPCSRQPKRLLKRFSTLNCMIASPNAKFGGFYRFRTTSEISSRQLYTTLLHFCGLKGLCPGVLRGLPFRLVVRPMQVSPVVNGKATTSTVQVVHVEYMHSDLKALQAAATEQRELEFRNYKTMLEYDQNYRQLVAAQRANPELDDEDLEDETKPDLPILQLGARKSEADLRAEEQGTLLEAIAQAAEKSKTTAELLQFWNDNVRPARFWNLLDKDQQAAAMDLWRKRKAEIENPPAVVTPPAEEVPDAEHAEVAGPDMGDAGPDMDEGPSMAGDEQGPDPTASASVPNANATPSVNAPAETADAQPPLKAGAGIITAIQAHLGSQRTYAQARNHYKALNLPEKMDDLTARNALQLLEALKAEQHGN